MLISLNAIPWSSFFELVEEEYGFRILRSELLDERSQKLYVRFHSGMEIGLFIRFEYQSKWTMWQLALYTEDRMKCLSVVDITTDDQVEKPKIKDYKSYLGLKDNEYIAWDTTIERLLGGPIFEVRKIDDLTRYVRLETLVGTKEYVVGFVIIPELDNRMEVHAYSAKEGEFLASLDSAVLDREIIVTDPVEERLLNPKKEAPSYCIRIKRDLVGRSRLIKINH